MIGVIIAALKIYQLLIIIRAVQSWINVDERHPMVRLVAAATEPVLGPIRSFTQVGNLDLSPIVVIVVVQIIIRMLSG